MGRLYFKTRDSCSLSVNLIRPLARRCKYTPRNVGTKPDRRKLMIFAAIDMERVDTAPLWTAQAIPAEAREAVALADGASRGERHAFPCLTLV